MLARGTRLSFALAALALGFGARAAAHGPPPAASALLGFAEGEATLVRLNRGLAQRTQDGFRLLCPEAWDGDSLAPVAGLPDGAALIGGERLFVLGRDGSVSPHAAQPGAGVALVSAGGAVFALFAREGQHELWRIDASAGERLRVLDEPFSALAAREDELALLAWKRDVLVLQTLALTGELRTRVTWNTLNVVAYAELRVAAEQLYVVTWGSARPWVTLGRVGAGGYEPLREAKRDIAGPVALGASVLLARDDVLELLDGGAFAGAAEEVTCLGSLGGEPYACATGDLRRVAPDGFGALLFARATLRAPDYRGLSEEARRDCATRWLDVQIHLENPDLSGAEVDAGAQSADPHVPEDGEGAAQLVGAERSASCALGVRRASAGGLAGIVFGLLVAWRCRARSGASRESFLARVGPKGRPGRPRG